MTGGGGGVKGSERVGVRVRVRTGGELLPHPRNVLGRTGAQLPQSLCLRRSIDQLERRGRTIRCEHLGC